VVVTAAADRRWSPAAATWTLAVVIASVAAALYALLVVHLSPPHHTLPIGLFVALFAAAEVFVVHVEFRKDAHTFSLVDVPLVLGLFFASPRWLMPAHVIGAALALGLVRRQKPLKLTYNLVAFALEDAIALVVFRAVADASPLSTRSWVAAFVAAVIAAVVAVGAVTAAIAVSGGQQTRAQRLQSLLFALTTTAIGASTAIALAVLAHVDSRAVLLLVAPIAALYATNRLAVAQRNDRRSIELLNSSAGLLYDDPDTGRALRRLLDQTRNLFQADVAALAYTPESDPESIALWVVGPAAEVAPLRTTPRATTWPAWVELAPRGQTTLIGTRRAVARDLLNGVAVRDGMVAPVILGSRVIGYLLVANRLSEVNRFSATDLLVLETIGRQLSAAVEDGELERPLHQMRVFERQLAYRESRDALTGLASGPAFATQLDRRLGVNVDEATVAAIVVDVSSHDEQPICDPVLLVTAERLAHIVRQEDVVARLDTHRFAILAAVQGGEPVFTEMLDRVQASLARTMHVDAEQVNLQLQIGAAFNAYGDTAETMLDRAYLAMVRT
jgi:GGDEF domain-containing protein